MLFYRNLAARFFQFPAYVVFMLFNVTDIGVACFSSVHHELMKHRFRLVAHVKCPFAVFCQELLYSYRVGIHIIAMKTQCVVRAFLIQVMVLVYNISRIKFDTMKSGFRVV